jgi:hypothetical protein
MACYVLSNPSQSRPWDKSHSSFVIHSLPKYLLWHFVTYWCSLDINLLDTWVISVFSQFVGNLFLLLICFVWRNILVLHDSIYFWFCFCDNLKIDYQGQYQGAFLLFCFSRTFRVSFLTFRFLIHFELIFVYRRRLGSSFIFVHVDIQFYQHNSWEECSFPSGSS